MNYEKKYLKYKTKYLNLKNIQHGGKNFDEEKKILIDKLDSERTKLLFPESIILSLKNKINNDYFTDTIINYNKTLKKIRSLYPL